MKRLTKKQKEHLLKCIGEGLDSGEINALAAQFKPAYSVDRQLVDYYRETRGVKLQEIKDASESDALRTGLALKEERVAALKALAERLKRELLASGTSGKLWVLREKAIGSGPATKFIQEYDFNLTQINALRALLDDIAKEMGERTYGSREALPEEEDTGNVTVTVRYEEKPKQAEAEE